MIKSEKIEKETKELQKIYSAEPLLEQFRVDICLRAKEIDEAADLDWYDMSIGYFLAKGADIEKAFYLARMARYRFQYFENITIKNASESEK
jgi:hypothetical protein